MISVAAEWSIIQTHLDKNGVMSQTRLIARFLRLAGRVVYQDYRLYTPKTWHITSVICF